jgi:hypothetical protein
MVYNNNLWRVMRRLGTAAAAGKRWGDRTKRKIKYGRRSVLLLEDESLDSFSTNAQPLQKIHTRMPVILLPETHERWLAGKEILLRFPVEAKKIRAVSARVNKPENNDPGLLERR